MGRLVLLVPVVVALQAVRVCPVAPAVLVVLVDLVVVVLLGRRLLVVLLAVPVRQVSVVDSSLPDGTMAHSIRSPVARGGQVLRVQCGHDLAVRETTSLLRKPLLRL